ncbi:MAG: hypothetical protein J6B88_07685 [Clostridia bacterium]|nr:hypothetical protein [Clostridia bacterium]
MNNIIEKIHQTDFKENYATTEEDLQKYIEFHKRKLFEILDDENSETLLKLINCMEELYLLRFEREYELGFKTGGKIVSEIFSK